MIFQICVLRIDRISMALTLSLAFVFALVNSNLTAQEIGYDEDLMEAFGDQLPQLIKPNAPVKLAYKPSGKQLKYQLKVDMKMDMMGMVIPRDDEFVVGMTIEEGNSDGELIVKSDLLDMISEMKTQGGTIRIDTRNPKTERIDAPFRPLEKIWRAMLDAESEFEITSDGIVDGFQPPEKIRKAIEDEDGNYGISPLDMSANFLTGILSLPDKALDVGDEWDVQVVISPMGTKATENKATFLGLGIVDDKNYAVFQISFQSSVEDSEGIITDAENATKSVVLFDIESGRIFKQFSFAEADMVLRIGENEMQQTTVGNTVISLLNE